MIKIITVDNHIVFSEALKTLIESFNNMKVVEQLHNGQEIIDYCSVCKELPDIILMDVQMPLLNGIEATKWIHYKYPNIRIIAFTLHDTKDIIINMLNAGVKSYLTKDIKPSELQTAILETQEKGFYNTKQILDLGLQINNQ